ELIPLSEERTCLRFSVSSQTEEKLRRARDVCGVKGLEEILELALEALLEKKDPARREERRRKRGILRSAQDDESRQDDENRHAEPQAKHPKIPRSARNDGSAPDTLPVSAKLKDKLLRESGYQC